MNEPNEIKLNDLFGNKRVVFCILYFTNFALIYQYRPEMIYEANLTPSSFLWVWGSLSVLYYLSPEIKKLFPSKKKKGKEPKPDILILMLQVFLSLGIIPAVIVTVYTDFKILISLL